MLGASDYIIVVAYFILTVALGLYFARKWKGSEDFFLAGRSLTWPLIGLSLFATNISTEHLRSRATPKRVSGALWQEE